MDEPTPSSKSDQLPPSYFSHPTALFDLTFVAHIGRARGREGIGIFIRHLLWARRRQWHPTPVLLPGKSHGWRSLEGCSPWGHWGSDTTERLPFYFSLSCTGEGNSNPLQCSCLENPREGGAWWAAISGVTQSWTRLKWLSSSSPEFILLPLSSWINLGKLLNL